MAPQASAEPYFAVSSGVGFPLEVPRAARLKGSVTGENPHNVGYTDFDFDDSTSVGSRVGYWFDAFPYLGVETNLSYFSPDLNTQSVFRFEEFNRQFSTGSPPVLHQIFSDIDVLSVGIVTLARVPIWRFTPYAGAGLAVQHVDIKEFRVDDVPVRADDDTLPSVQYQGGLKFYFTSNLGLFLEYVYTTGDLDTIIGRIGGDPGALDTIEVDFDNQIVQGGIEFRFGDPFAK